MLRRGCRVGSIQSGGVNCGSSVGSEVDGPLLAVDEGVVGAAEQDPVVEAGGSAVGPVGDVVHVAPAGRPVAAGEGAAEVAELDGASEFFGEDPDGAADVERHPGGVQQHRQDGGVAGDPADVLGGDGGAGVQGADADGGLELVVADGDRDVGGEPERGRGLVGGEGAAADLDQGVGVALTRRCGGLSVTVRGRNEVGFGERFQRGRDQCPGLWVELAAEPDPAAVVGVGGQRVRPVGVAGVGAGECVGLGLFDQVGGEVGEQVLGVAVEHRARHAGRPSPASAAHPGRSPRRRGWRAGRAPPRR